MKKSLFGVLAGVMSVVAIGSGLGCAGFGVENTSGQTELKFIIQMEIVNI